MVSRRVAVSPDEESSWSFTEFDSIRTAAAAAVLLTLGVVPSMAQSTSVASLDGVWRLNRAASTQPGDVENHAVASDTMSDAQVSQLKEINRVMGQTSVQLTIAIRRRTTSRSSAALERTSSRRTGKSRTSRWAPRS